MNRKNNLNPAGHRERLRRRFLKAGFNGFHDYEVLELLLSYAIPRKDTKVIAKDLLSKFKSLTRIMDADLEELEEIQGVGPQVALFVKIVREAISKYYTIASFERKSFARLEDLVDYLRATIGGRSNEVMHILLLNSKNELLHAQDLGEGTVTEAVAFPRTIVELALKHSAATVIIAHNHPGGDPEPSENDNAVTKSIADALKSVNVSLQEHIVISDDDYYSYRKHGYFDKC